MSSLTLESETLEGKPILSVENYSFPEIATLKNPKRYTIKIGLFSDADLLHIRNSIDAYLEEDA